MKFHGAAGFPVPSLIVRIRSTPGQRSAPLSRSANAFRCLHVRRRPSPSAAADRWWRDSFPRSAHLHDASSHLLSHRPLPRPHRAAPWLLPNQLQLKPVVLVRRNVAQQHRMAVHHVDHRIDLAVVEQVANGHDRARQSHPPARPSTAGMTSNFLPPDVVKQQRPLRPACAPPVSVRLRIHVPIRHQQIFPAIVVVVDKRIAPARKGTRPSLNPISLADVRQVRIAFVAIERLVNCH